MNLRINQQAIARANANIYTQTCHKIANDSQLPEWRMTCSKMDISSRAQTKSFIYDKLDIKYLMNLQINQQALARANVNIYTQTCHKLPNDSQLPAWRRTGTETDR